MFACVVGAICKSPYAVACVFPSIRPHFKFTPISNSPPFQIRHVTIHPHMEGRIAIRPYTCVFWTFANIHVNIRKKHHGHGVSMFACVVGANCNSPILQITHIANRPCYNSPPLQIRPIPNSPPFQIRHVTIHPHSKFTPIANRPWDKKLKKSFLL